MKAVCMKVYSLYPEFDLSEKKAFIKETVKAVRIRCPSPAHCCMITELVFLLHYKSDSLQFNAGAIAIFVFTISIFESFRSMLL